MKDEMSDDQKEILKKFKEDEELSDYIKELGNKLDAPDNLAKKITELINGTKLGQFDLPTVLAKVFDNLDWDYGSDGNTKNNESINGYVIKGAVDQFRAIRMGKALQKIEALYEYLIDRKYIGIDNLYEYSGGDRQFCAIPTKNANKVFYIENQNIQFVIILEYNENHRGVVKFKKLHLRELGNLSMEDVLKHDFI